MDFTLTNEQMKKYVARCIAAFNKITDNNYTFKVLECKYPEMKIFCSNGKVFWDETLKFYRDDVKCLRTPLSPYMQEIYIQYLYELFGEEYLYSLEKDMRKEISAAKQAAYEKYKEKTNKLDSKLVNYLLLLSDAKNDILRQ